MKILYVITSLRTGGAEKLVVSLMPRLHSMGYKVGVVLFNGKRTALMKQLEVECPECEVYSLGDSFYNPFYIFKLIRIMRKYNVIHTHNSSPQLYAAIANLFCRKKLVTTEHSTNNRKRELGGLFRLVDKWMYSRYNKIVCISDIAEKKLRQYLNNNSSKICTIYNGVDVQTIGKALPIEGLKADRCVIVMVAGFREAKDQDTLIRAMSKLPNQKFELWLVGDGVRRKELEELVGKLEIADCVKFMGVRLDVPNILKTADIIVMSSHWEGLSLSNIEGMSAGKPFIASEVDGLREVTNGYGVLFPHGDDLALAKEIQHLAEDKEYADMVAKRCQLRAAEFDISVMAEKYNQVYLELINPQTNVEE